MMDHHCLEEGDWVIPNKQNPAEQKMLKKSSCRGGHGENIKEVLSGIIILSFYIKKILAQAFAQRKKCTT